MKQSKLPLIRMGVIGVAVKKGKQSKSSKMGKENQGMNKGKSTYHDIRRERTGKEEDNPYYMEDTESER